VDEPARCPDPPRTQAMPADVERALNTLRSASGRSSSSARAWRTRAPRTRCAPFIERTKVPFLASPMGKGVMPDTHPLSVGAARSHALQNADVVFLMGARLNWIMHSPAAALQQERAIIQLDIAPESIGRTRRPKSPWSATQGNRRADQRSARQARVGLSQELAVARRDRRESRANAAQIAPQLADDQAPANYYRALKDVAAWTPETRSSSARAPAR